MKKLIKLVAVIYWLTLNFNVSASSYDPKIMMRLKKEAEGGNINSAIEYGKACTNIFIQMDLNGKYYCSSNEAFKLVKKFADKGDPKAQNFIGEMLFNGNGVPKNYVDSFQYFMQSATQGDPQGQAWVAEYYDWIGVAVEKSPMRAYLWYLLSLSDGRDILSSNKLHELEGRLTHEQIIAVQAIAKKCYMNSYKDCE